ncbi:tyrosine-type recombinase/integrase [Sphingomonas immobilis]|uniref:Tyrosine-type recombinase/integrase n=1 Tax=Sphingomonas immobilis TaxID=3063997 RepID=A0ABT9A1G1_9SPHN|nr:tyrosine-type recombinase/integrase [Sphingomonas sp. CA1-15]MDO7843640.1 tyrosine-type recombinase/integrase [Sphingomonas sp. CA1-15]
MARTVIDYRLQDRAARSRLKVRHETYWRSLSEGVHLGYRKGRLKGSWIARCKMPDARYVTGVLGEADDHCDRDGKTILSYREAFEAALRWVEASLRGPDVTDDNSQITVAEAVRAYLVLRDARRAKQVGRLVRSDAHYKLTPHVLDDETIAPLLLANIAEKDLREWQMRISRTNPGGVQRLVNDFKAALNAAYAEHRRQLPADLPNTIKWGLTVSAPEISRPIARENQILSDDQMRKIVAAARALDEDFGRLVVMLAATGARFAQLARMTVGDVQAEHNRVLVPQSFKGKKRVLQYIRVQVGADTLAELAPVTKGRSPTATLLERWRHKQIAPMTWERVDRGPWYTASEMSQLWKQTVVAAGLPTSTIPYALRHSSIVRGLRFGLPIRLVAALHDTSVGMIERHYARWITEGLDELAARAVIPIAA